MQVLFFFVCFTGTKIRAYWYKITCLLKWRSKVGMQVPTCFTVTKVLAFTGTRVLAYWQVRGAVMKRADEASKSKTIGNLVASFQRQVLTLLVLFILRVSLVQEHLLAALACWYDRTNTDTAGRTSGCVRRSLRMRQSSCRRSKKTRLTRKALEDRPDKQGAAK
jgi:hypothetical protein